MAFHFSNIVEKSLYSAGKLLIGTETSCNNTARVATEPNSAATESIECSDLARIDRTRKVMAWLHESNVGLCVSNEDRPKTIGCRGVAMR